MALSDLRWGERSSPHTDSQTDTGEFCLLLLAVAAAPISPQLSNGPLTAFTGSVKVRRAITRAHTHSKKKKSKKNIVKH